MDTETAPSPFLPGTKVQYALDSTSIGYFKTCPRLYYYSMIECWRSREESVHLTFGKLYHEALHIYDILRLDGLNHEESVYQVVKWLCDQREGYPDVSEAKPSMRAKSFEALLRTVVWYMDRYPREEDPAQTVTLENGKPACELSFRFELDWGPQQTLKLEAGDFDVGDPQPYLLCGHLDRVVTFNDDVYVMDRKTTAWAPSELYWSQWSPHNQMSLYSIAAKVVLGAPVKGIILDAAQVAGETKTHGPFSEFFRGFTYRTEDQNEEWLQDLRSWTSAMEACATSGQWPMNDTACDKYGGCRFREVCSKSPSVRERFLDAGFERAEQWNPLQPR